MVAWTSSARSQRTGKNYYYHQVQTGQLVVGFWPGKI